MSISTVVTRGYGSYSTVNFVPTRGYNSGSGPPPPTGNGNQYITHDRGMEPALGFVFSSFLLILMILKKVIT